MDKEERAAKAPTVTLTPTVTMNDQRSLEVQARDFILEESRKGNVVFMGLEGLTVAPLDEFIKQPAEGILYDLNRLPEVVLTFIDDPKWVNDFAVSMVIKRLRELVEPALAEGRVPEREKEEK